MSSPRKYISKSNVLTRVYLVFFLLIMAIFLWAERHRLMVGIMFVVIHIPLIAAPYLMESYYLILDGQIVKRDNNITKRELNEKMPHALIIPIEPIEVIEFKKKQGSVACLTLKSLHNDIPLGKITIKHAEKFIDELRLQNDIFELKRI